MADKEIAIKVSSVGKTFQPQSSSRTVKEAFISVGRKLSGRHRLTYHEGEYTALNDISFEISKGDFFGIVGRNGSGKSTLLKILAGVYTPTKGSVQINGMLTPFIELGVGFNPELSGHDNVFLNGALLGFSHQQMEAMYDDIVDFAELHDFMDTKLKNYSSGMQVRLAFSVAIRADSDILLIDEVLAVGDSAFQAKCEEYFVQLKNEKRTVVLVTHDMNAVRKYCDRVMLIDKGIHISSNNPKIIADQYEEINNKDFKQEVVEVKSENNKIYKESRIIAFATTDEHKDYKKVFSYKEKIRIVLTYKIDKDINNCSIDIGLTLGKNGLLVFYYDSGNDNKVYSGKKGDEITVECIVENIFSEGTYYVISSMYNFASYKVYARNRALTKVRLKKLPTNGIVLPNHSVNIIKE